MIFLVVVLFGVVSQVSGEDDWRDKKPGTLLLNMLIKNEAEHLDRSLPKWAPLIDCWIIGVDDKNTDNSEEVIHKHLGHIPGQTVSLLLLPFILVMAVVWSCLPLLPRGTCTRLIPRCRQQCQPCTTISLPPFISCWPTYLNAVCRVAICDLQVVVNFDGMGPTWTVLVEKGLELYPNCTHGIVSDADFTPITTKLDKSQLDTECSKHMFQIMSFDGGTVRNMDWIYRNIPGAAVRRRTHQSVEVPVQPGQRVFQTLINLVVQEYSGGYQDRSGKKSQTYLNWLHKDLEEMPGDPRTIYYLGHAHLEQIGPDARNAVLKGAPEAEHVHKALEYFRWRADIRFGYHEERWFAMLKAGEICERWLADYQCSQDTWHMAHKLDPERVDALFYIGQHWRLAQQPARAIPYLIDAAKLRYPERSLFNWDYMYACLRHLELGRAGVAAGDSLSLSELKLIKKSLKIGVEGCTDERAEAQRLYGSISKALKAAKEKDKKEQVVR
jgi:hypothetical protein